MTFKQLASLIAKHEGKKHQASIGDIREILKIYFDLLCDDKLGQKVCDLTNKETDKRVEKKNKHTEEESDPTPYCNWCGAGPKKTSCECPTRAEND